FRRRLDEAHLLARPALPLVVVRCSSHADALDQAERRVLRCACAYGGLRGPRAGELRRLRPGPGSGLDGRFGGVAGFQPEGVGAKLLEVVPEDLRALAKAAAKALLLALVPALDPELCTHLTQRELPSIAASL